MSDFDPKHLPLDIRPPAGQGRCATCRFWAQHPREPGRRAARRLGDCRRYPPSELRLNISQWPKTQARHWCGEHQHDLYRDDEDDAQEAAS